MIWVFLLKMMDNERGRNEEQIMNFGEANKIGFDDPAGLVQRGLFAYTRIDYRANLPDLYCRLCTVSI